MQGATLLLTKVCINPWTSLLRTVVLIPWQLFRKDGQESNAREVPKRESPTPLKVAILPATRVFMAL